MRRAIWVVVAIVAVGFAGSERAQADSAAVQLGLTPIGITRPYFELIMQPGESRELTVEVANLGASTLTARTFAANVYTIANGGMGVALDGEAATGTTTWLTYEPLTVELKPREAVQRIIRVHVPAGTSPGEYTTSVAAQNAEPVAIGGSGGVAVNQVIRRALAVVIAVPGAQHTSLQVGAAGYREAPNAAAVTVDVTNTGNTRLRPNIETTLTDDHNRVVARNAFTMDTFFAGTNTIIELPLAAPLPAGQYTVSFSAAEGETAIAAPSLPLEVSAPIGVGATTSPATPWSTLAGGDAARRGIAWNALFVALGAAGCIGLIALRVRRPTSSTVPDLESIRDDEVIIGGEAPAGGWQPRRPSRRG